MRYFLIVCYFALIVTTSNEIVSGNINTGVIVQTLICFSMLALAILPKKMDVRFK